MQYMHWSLASYVYHMLQEIVHAHFYSNAFVSMYWHCNTIYIYYQITSVLHSSDHWDRFPSGNLTVSQPVSQLVKSLLESPQLVGWLVGYTILWMTTNHHQSYIDIYCGFWFIQLKRLGLGQQNMSSTIYVNIYIILWQRQRSLNKVYIYIYIYVCVYMCVYNYIYIFTTNPISHGTEGILYHGLHHWKYFYMYISITRASITNKPCTTTQSSI